MRKYHYETIDVANNRNETLNMLYEKIKKKTTKFVDFFNTYELVILVVLMYHHSHSLTKLV